MFLFSTIYHLIIVECLLSRLFINWIKL